MRAQDQLATAIGDQFQETEGAIIDHRPVELGIRHGRNHAVRVSLPRLLLGQANPGIVGVGEPARGKEVVGRAAVRVEHGILCRRLAFEMRRLHEHVPSVRIPHRVDVRHDAAEVLVHRDGRPFRRDAGIVQPEITDIGGPAGGHDDGVEIAGCRIPARTPLEGDRAIGGRGQALDAIQARMNRDTLRNKGGGHGGGDIRVRCRQHSRSDV